MRKPKPPASSRALIIRASLEYITPPIWRELSIPEHFTLAQLHRALQLTFGWLDCHLYRFTAGATHYADPRAEVGAKNATKTTLAALAFPPQSTLTYVYDFGDDWEHVLVVQRIHEYAPDDRRAAVLLDGARACPPEDSGGPPGYAQLLTARSDPTDPDHAAALEWLGPSFDPERFDLRRAADALTVAGAWGAI